MANRIVTRADLEADLLRLGEGDPEAGVFGPDSMMWAIGRESVVLLAGGRAALLQIAHPYVAEAVVAHSQVFDDLALRFRRTLSKVYAMTFGTRDDAFGLARQIHTMHSGVHGAMGEAVGGFAAGHRYHANTPDALLWVAATLWDSSTDIFGRTIRPLGAAEMNRYWLDARRMAGLFGHAQSALPASWAEFCAYRDAMFASETLAVGAAARHIARHILTPPRPAAAPMYRWLRMFTAGLLPPRLREAFELPFGPTERAVFAASLATLRRTVRHLPPSLRYTPAYLRARRRLDGRGGHDPVAATLRRLSLTLLQKPRARGADA
ncbi:MAG: DUF2236 domain-containing protein [Myxococcales bacterium]|nr:DUF2236 domain-containing protein [Myxococcales bacterium]